MRPPGALCASCVHPCTTCRRRSVSFTVRRCSCASSGRRGRPAPEGGRCGTLWMACRAAASRPSGVALGGGASFAAAAAAAVPAIHASCSATHASTVRPKDGCSAFRYAGGSKSTGPNASGGGRGARPASCLSHRSARPPASQADCCPASGTGRHEVSFTATRISLPSPACSMLRSWASGCTVAPHRTAMQGSPRGPTSVNCAHES